MHASGCGSVGREKRMLSRPFALASPKRPSEAWSYRLNLEFHREWDGRYYGVQQVVPVVAEEGDRLVVVTVYVFYFQEGARP